MEISVNSYDIIIIGAGISGICAAYHIKTKLPDKSFIILEKRSDIGGTWDVFRYPGIRSDSDMFTFGYSFNPWSRKDYIADGSTIISYLKETIDKFHLKEYIHFNMTVTTAAFITKESTWVISVNTSDNQCISMRSQYLFLCSGYYNHENGFIPDFPHITSFKGQGRVIHPQNWPNDVNYDDKSIIVIGSGATAVTLIPSLAKTARHVVMLQRSPTYIHTAPRSSFFSHFLTRYLPSCIHGPVNRWLRILDRVFTYALCRSFPLFVKKLMIKAVRDQLPQGYDVNKHFTPYYNPWDQRICLAPDGDLFQTISDGKATVITDTIDSFTEKGILLSSGEEIQADLVITATGLNLSAHGGIQFKVDDHEVVPSDCIAYKTLMCTGLPNLYFAMGYTNSSWTLKCDLTIKYMCRVLQYMDRHHYRTCCPVMTDSERKTLILSSLLYLKSGYVARGADCLPRQGHRYPWSVVNNHLIDWMVYHFSSVKDANMMFS